MTHQTGPQIALTLYTAKQNTKAQRGHESFWAVPKEADDDLAVGWLQVGLVLLLCKALWVPPSNWARLLESVKL